MPTSRGSRTVFHMASIPPCDHQLSLPMPLLGQSSGSLPPPAAELLPPGARMHTKANSRRARSAAEAVRPWLLWTQLHRQSGLPAAPGGVQRVPLPCLCAHWSETVDERLYGRPAHPGGSGM